LLQDQGVHIWDGNSSREFLESRGLTAYDVNELGPLYGSQWRHFNAPYITKKERRFAEGLPENEKAYYNIEGGVDQLQQIIDALKDPAQRTSRRLIMTAWNPCQLDQMSLPPCHIFCQFNVHNGDQLSCAMFQRSNDCALGIPFNIASYSFLTHLIAKHCGLEAHEFIHFMGNSHIYEDHVEPMKEQIKRNPHPFPTVSIKQVRENINDYCLDDFILENYQSHEAIKMKMVA
jgi:thymidylate synthase